jgi:general secretion pathway protein D
MPQPIHLRVPHRQWLAIAALCCITLATSTTAAAQATESSAQPAEDSASTSQTVEGTQGKRQVRAAQDAYLAGARRLERDDLAGAERDFHRAQQLDPANPDYGIAITVAREHRLTELIQQASRARLDGDSTKADTLLAEARKIDPANPIVLEHNSAALIANAALPQADPAARRAASTAGSQTTTPLTNRGQLLAAGESREPWKLQVASLAGTVQLQPATDPRSFHQRANSRDLLRVVASAYGIRVVFDDSVEQKNLRFDVENLQYEQAMPLLMSMAHVFAVPIDETSVLIAKDDTAHRQQFERLIEETVFLSGLTTEQVNDLGNVMRNVFQIKQVTVDAGLQAIIVRAPSDILGPMNRTIADLMDSSEVMLDVQLYEISTTRMRNLGATLPTQIGAYSVAEAASQLVSANPTLVQQAIAQGFISASSSPIQIALALIASGLVQSTLLSDTIGFLGGGLALTGITSVGTVGFNLAFNSSDSRALDDVQMRVQDRQPATFRAGTKYPIVTSTYSTGLSTPSSTLSNATINGVSVASLLAQFSGGSSTTVPQVTYEDLGVTLKATPVIQKSGRINLTLDMKIEALAGGTVNGNPILASRQFTSAITVADGEGALMVSNMNRTESAAVTGLPGLSELPGFQATTDQNAAKDTGQLVVVVTPHVVRHRSNLIAGPRILVRALDAPALAATVN